MRQEDVRSCEPVDSDNPHRGGESGYGSDEFTLAPEVRELVGMLDADTVEEDRRKEERRVASLAKEAGMDINDVFGEQQFDAYRMLCDLNGQILGCDNPNITELLLDLVDDFRRFSPSAWQRFINEEVKSRRRKEMADRGERWRHPSTDERAADPEARRIVWNQLFETTNDSPNERSWRILPEQFREIIEITEFEGEYKERTLRMLLKHLGISFDGDQVSLCETMSCPEIAKSEPAKTTRMSNHNNEDKPISRERARQIVNEAYAALKKAMEQKGLIDS